MGAADPRKSDQHRDLPNVGLAWGESWRHAIILLIEHIPLVVGVVAVSAVHEGRTRFLPAADDKHPWVHVVDVVLFVVEWVLFASLVIGPTITLLGEWGEAVGNARYRTLRAWHRKENSQ